MRTARWRHRARDRDGASWTLRALHAVLLLRDILRRVVTTVARALGCARFDARQGVRRALARALRAGADRGLDGDARGGTAGGTAARRTPRTWAMILASDALGDTVGVTCEKVVEVATWCREIGVERASVYEAGGTVADASGRKALRDALERRFVSTGYVLRACDAANGGKIEVIAERAPAAASTGRSIEIDALRAHDACAALLDAARRADLRREDECEDENVAFANKRDVGRLEEWMRENGSFLPPADVVVVFGGAFQLNGYPPWQLHAAELFHEKSLMRFSRSDFERIVEKYRATAQRFGR